MIEYSLWKRKSLSTTALRLDISNPRLVEFGETPNQTEIIDYLLDKEDIFDLAKAIATQGYLPNEDPIVYKQGSKYIVLEGNRRVSACKILIQPDLVKSSSKRKILNNLQKKFDLNIILKLDVIVAPSREDADVLIMNRHSGGSVVERWDKTKQDRFLYGKYKGGESIVSLSEKFAISKSDLKKAFIRHTTYQFISEIPFPEEIEKAVKDETKFSVTNLERTYESTYGANFLGIEYTDDGSIIKKLPQDELNKRWERITTDLVKGKINSRILNTELDKEKYFKSLETSGDFDLSIQPDEKYNSLVVLDDTTEQNEIVDIKKITPPKAINTKLFHNSIKIESGIERIDSIFWELKTINIKTHPNAVSVLLRSYLDMLTYQFLKKKSHIVSIKAEEGIAVATQNDKKIDAIKKYFIGIGVNEENIDTDKLKRDSKTTGNLKANWIPSLLKMLKYIAVSDTLIEDDKMREALRSHIGKDPKFIGHQEFNLLVHNEYYTADAEELRNVWIKLHPILEYFSEIIKKK